MPDEEQERPSAPKIGLREAVTAAGMVLAATALGVGLVVVGLIHHNSADLGLGSVALFLIGLVAYRVRTKYLQLRRSSGNLDS